MTGLWEGTGPGRDAGGSIPRSRWPRSDLGVALQARLAWLNPGPCRVLTPFISFLSGDEKATAGRSRREKTEGGGTSSFHLRCFVLVPLVLIYFVRVSNGLQGFLEGILRFLPKRRMPYFVDSKKKINPVHARSTYEPFHQLLCSFSSEYILRAVPEALPTLF